MMQYCWHAEDDVAHLRVVPSFGCCLGFSSERHDLADLLSHAQLLQLRSRPTV